MDDKLNNCAIQLLNGTGWACAAGLRAKQANKIAKNRESGIPTIYLSSVLWSESTPWNQRQTTEADQILCGDRRSVSLECLIL